MQTTSRSKKLLLRAVLVSCRRLSPAGNLLKRGWRRCVPRLVTPRGNLDADEKATIELFEKSRDSVVFITTKAQVQDFWSRNVFSVQRGTGSGFIWDNAGHIITNFHVVEGASEAIIRLSNGKDYPATLV
jgi:S1-C subfamily serine protease